MAPQRYLPMFDSPEVAPTLRRSGNCRCVRGPGWHRAACGEHAIPHELGLRDPISSSTANRLSVAAFAATSHRDSHDTADTAIAATITDAASVTTSQEGRNCARGLWERYLPRDSTTQNSPL